MPATSTRPGRPSLLAVTYNIHGALGGDGIRDPRRVAAVIRATGAGIVALQEVDSRPGALSDSAQMERLATATELMPSPGPTIVGMDRSYGNVLLTRYPVEALRRHDLSEPGREPRGAIDAVLRLPAGPLRVIATHLGLRLRERRRQVRKLVELLEESRELPLLLLGDFNEWIPMAGSLRRLNRRLGARPVPAAFPARRPFLALDRVWARPAGLIREVRIHAAAPAPVASDHLPLVVVVDYPARLPDRDAAP
jgi:endonuclease/exonuclease/phosphatase family metal-dependent hydrolase